jgi:nucleoside-diphosphate-sugar epimerase
VQRSVDDPIASNDANVNGTLNLLVAARAAGVRRPVYASSSSVYGDSPTLPKREEMTPQPKSPYAVSKLSAEHYCQAFTQVYGLETVSLRYFNVFGPRQDPASQYSAVVPIFITALLRGEAVTVHGDGLQSRDFTYVSNNVQANLLAATAPDVAGRAFNVACGKRYTLLELLDVLSDIVGVPAEKVHTPSRPGDVRHSLADISLAQQHLGYDVNVDFGAGLRQTVAWYRHHLMGGQSGV